MAAETLVKEQVCPKTLQQYKSKMGIMTKWIDEHFQLQIELPLDDEIRYAIMGFFGDLTDREDNKRPAYTSVSAYKSALLWFHKTKNLPFDETLNVKLKSLLRGYKHCEKFFQHTPVSEHKFCLCAFLVSKHDNICVQTQV